MSISLLVFVLFFFFKQKTAYEMRISDWSSDVCSSDLDDVIAQNVAGIAFLFKKNKIDSFVGIGSFVDKNTIKITNSEGKSEQITGKNIIIASGSKPTALPFLPIDKKRIITSTEALALDRKSTRLNSSH